MQSNAGLQTALIPGFSHEQSISIRGLMTAFQIAMDQAFDRHVGPLQQPVQQPNPTPPPPTQPNSLAKKKRNQKTRNQYKKKAQAQRVTIHEVEHLYGQEMEHLNVQISVEKASKHVALHRKAPWDWMTTSSQHAAVISWIEMAAFSGLIMVQSGAIWRPRMGVG